MTAKRDTKHIAGALDSGMGFGLQGFDPGALFVTSQRAAEAWAAASQTLLQGMQEVSQRSLMLQAALLEQSLGGAFSLLQMSQPGAKPEDIPASVQRMSEGTLQSMREIMTAACKCPMDALTVYHDRMAGREPLAADRAEPPRAAAG